MEKDTNPNASFDSARFKPMSEGLGLNHFADGLPYTPAASRRRAAVQFNFPPPRSAKMTPQPSEALRAAIAEFEAPPAADAEPSKSANAGFIRRVMAFGIDLVLAASMFAFIVWSGFSLNGFDLTELLMSRRGVQMFWPLTLLYAVFHLGYFLIQETTWRRTLGKALMGIRIQTSSGFAALGRAACFFVSTIPLGIGLFWYFFDPKRRCWHDVITDSEVITS